MTKQGRFDKLKKAQERFGEAPLLETPLANLEAPESVPVGLPRKSRGKTHRVEPLNFKVTAEFKKDFKQLALDTDQKLVELLEVCVDYYKKVNGLH